MKLQKLVIGTLCILMVTTFLANGQGFLKADGKVIVNSAGDTVLLRGMGLGGWMLQEGYMLQTADFASAQYQIRNKIEELIGAADTELFYDTWLSNHMRKIDVDSLKAWGFNSVRLPMHYNLFTLPVEEEPVAGQNTWLTKGFELTDSLISWCRQNEMYVILDLHAAPGGQGYDQGISDYDPTKPSLWESFANQNKTIALWKKLAERYVNEPWVGGYDLLNETNWNMPGNGQLHSLYRRLTDTIRTVDNNHMLIIEGNWFANDFTGLTPPWDNNMAYGPHKYWSHNNKADIQWVLSIRDQHNVPLYFGESGENSNAWFRDAIRLFEDHKIGWAWWPLKKVESISCPLSITKNNEYQTLLNYWSSGGNKPSAAFAKAALMQLAENLKLENCTYQKDVIDAMFRQVRSDETMPFNKQSIPGTVYASEYDMGVPGSAYYDTEVATYHVSTGNYTAWNNGWTYRNDGVDIENCSDFKSNGYNVGWVEENEWIQYDVEVQTDAVYDIEVRIATGTWTGKIHFIADGADICQPTFVPVTGGWNNWQTFTIPDVFLDTSVNKLRLYADGGGFNISGFEFIQKGSSTSIDAAFVSAITDGQNAVTVSLNKPLAEPLPTAPGGFELFVNGNPITINEIVLNGDNSRLIKIVTDHTFQSSEEIKISYSGTQITARDGTPLNVFSLEEVKNTSIFIHELPGKVEAEDYFFQEGISLETTTDIGGGENVGHLDEGDYLDYYIMVPQSGLYDVSYRTAAESASGGINLSIIGEDGSSTLLHSVRFDPTGGWQNWETTDKTVVLPGGIHKIRMDITHGLFNINWFEFSFLSSTRDESQIEDLKVYPNPSNGPLYLEAQLSSANDVEIEVYSLLGQTVLTRMFMGINELNEKIDLTALPAGNYLLITRLSDGRVDARKIQLIQ